MIELENNWQQFATTESLILLEKNDNNTIYYYLALLSGLVIGLVTNPWSGFVTQDPKVAERAKESQSLVRQSKDKRAHTNSVPNNESNGINSEKAELDSSIDSEVDKPELNIDGSTWSGQQLLDYIGSLDESDFWNHVTSGELRSALDESPSLLDELMYSVLDTSDPLINRRLLYLFENMQSNHSSNQTGVQHPIEKWIMQRVDSGNRPTQWLSYLSKLGVSSKESYMSLSARLRDYAPPEQITPILSLMARKPYGLVKSLNADELLLLNQTIEPYFSSDDHEHRMFAVASLSDLPFEQSQSKLQSAMSDDSVRVRMSAMRIIRDNRFKSGEITQSLIASLSDTSLSAYERLGAYEVLSQATLSQEEYETVYHFAANERVGLEKEFHANRQAAQNQDR